jgi:hypothetical protein
VAELAAQSWGEEQIEWQVRQLDRNPLLTLAEMARLVQGRFEGLQVSTATISRALDKQLITLKCLSRDADIPAARNAPENRLRRREFTQWLTELPPDHHLVFIDETGFNLWTRRSQGRSRRGQRVRRVVVTQRGVQVNLVQAVSPTAGLLHHKIVAATMTAERFQTFVEELLEVVSSRNDIGDSDQMHIVMDGARFHGRMQITEQYAANWRDVTLPPYSPFLNPVENAHSCVKAAIKRALSQPEVAERDGPATSGHSAVAVADSGSAQNCRGGNWRGDSCQMRRLVQANAATSSGLLGRGADR